MSVPFKVIASVIAVGISMLVAVQFLWLVEPAAAREVDAACRGLDPAPRSKTIRRMGGPAPSLVGVDHEGKKVSLSDLRGKVVLVNFWASWCSTCKAEKPSLERLQSEMPDDFVVLAMASDTGWDPIVKRYPKGLGVDVVLDKVEEESELGPMAKAWGVGAFPESFSVDRKGNLRHYFINKRDWDSDVAVTCLRGLVDE